MLLSEAYRTAPKIEIVVSGARGPKGNPGSGGNVVDSRSALASIAASEGDSFILTESGRFGLFRFSSANHAIDVAADLWQGVFVAPASDPTGASGAWIRQVVTGIGLPEWFGAQGDGLADDKPAISACLNHPRIRAAWLSSVYGVNSKVWVPAGKTLDGEGPEVAEIKVLPTYDLSGSTATKRHFVVSSELGAENVTIRNIAVNGNRRGLGEGVDNRVTLIAPQGSDFLVENCWAYEGTGYALYARGETGQEASGTFRRCRSWNCDTLMEAAHARRVTFEDCHSHTTEDTVIECQEAIIPWSDSEDITFIRCSFRGVAGSGIGLTTVSQPMLKVTFIDCVIEMLSDNMALSVQGPHKVKAVFQGGSLKSDGSVSNVALGANLENCEIDLIGTYVEGATGINVNNDVVLRLNGSKVVGTVPVGAAYVSRGITVTGTSGVDVRTSGGSIESYGPATPGFTQAIAGQLTYLDPATRIVPESYASKNVGIEQTITAGAYTSGTLLNNLGWYRLTKTDGNFLGGGTTALSLIGDFWASFIFWSDGFNAAGVSTDVSAGAGVAELDAGFSTDGVTLFAVEAGVEYPIGVYRPGEMLHIRRMGETVTLLRGGHDPDFGDPVRNFALASTLGFESTQWGLDTHIDARVATF